MTTKNFQAGDLGSRIMSQVFSMGKEVQFRVYCSDGKVLLPEIDSIFPEGDIIVVRFILKNGDQ